MVSEHLTRIKEYEMNAADLISNAKKEAKKMVEDATRMSSANIAQAEKEAKQKYDDLINEGERIANSQYDDIISGANIESDSFAKKSEKHMQSAVFYVIERTVGSRVNN